MPGTPQGFVLLFLRFLASAFNICLLVRIFLPFFTGAQGGRLYQFVYEITESKIVEQDQVEILEEKGDNRVTLIACHPKYSAAQRFILIGKLVGKPAPPLTGQAEAQDKAREENNGDALAKGSGIDGGLSGTTASKWHWGLVAAPSGSSRVIQTLLRRRVRRRVEGERPSRAKRLLT